MELIETILKHTQNGFTICFEYEPQYLKIIVWDKRKVRKLHVLLLVNSYEGLTEVRIVDCINFIVSKFV